MKSIIWLQYGQLYYIYLYEYNSNSTPTIIL